MSKKDNLKKQNLDLTREYYREVHAVQLTIKAGQTRVNYGGRYKAFIETTILGSRICHINGEIRRAA